VIAECFALACGSSPLRIGNLAGRPHVRSARRVDFLPAGIGLSGGGSELAPRQQGRYRKNQAK
jgi:hypothetical protein